MKKNIFLILITIIISLLSLSFFRIHVLIIESVQHKNTLFLERIQPNDEFTLKWMHSVELQPWEEIFKIDNQYNIILDRTRFKQFGAGVPDYAGNKTEIKDGYIIFSGINKEMSNIPYGISSFAKHTFYFKDKQIKLYEIIEDGESVNIYSKNIGLLNYIYRKITTSKL